MSANPIYMPIGPRTVTEDWPVRISNSVFTVPKGATVTIEQDCPEVLQSLVRFGDREIEWFSYWTINSYTEAK